MYLESICKCLKINGVFPVYKQSNMLLDRNRQTLLHLIRDAASDKPKQTMKQHILAALTDAAALTTGDTVKAVFHKSASADLRSYADRQMRSENGQFASIAGKVASIKQTSTGLQLIILRTDGHDKPYGSLTTNQVIRSLEVNGTSVML